MTPEQLNAWRVIPRLMVLFVGYMTYSVGDWFMGLESPTNAQGAFVAVVFGVVPMAINAYCSTGGNKP